MERYIRHAAYERSKAWGFVWLRRQVVPPPFVRSPSCINPWIFSRREISCVGAGRRNLFTLADSGDRPTLSTFRHVQIPVRSELQPSRIVQSPCKMVDVRRWPLRPRPDSST